MQRPNTQTLALLDAVRAAHGNCSDYIVARKLGIQSSQTSAWRKRGIHMSDGYAAACAELAGIDPVAAVLRVAAERETAATPALQRALAKLTGIAASILLAVGLVLGSSIIDRAAAGARLAPITNVCVSSHSIYYVKWIIGAFRGRLRRLLSPAAGFHLAVA
jgi:hypothetical protein